jgi:hypothetical protein
MEGGRFRICVYAKLKIGNGKEERKNHDKIRKRKGKGGYRTTTLLVCFPRLRLSTSTGVN